MVVIPTMVIAPKTPAVLKKAAAIDPSEKTRNMMEKVKPVTAE